MATTMETKIYKQTSNIAMKSTTTLPAPDQTVSTTTMEHPDRYYKPQVLEQSVKYDVPRRSNPCDVPQTQNMTPTTQTSCTPQNQLRANTKPKTLPKPRIDRKEEGPTSSTGAASRSTNQQRVNKKPKTLPKPIINSREEQSTGTSPRSKNQQTSNTKPKTPLRPRYHHQEEHFGSVPLARNEQTYMNPMPFRAVGESFSTGVYTPLNPASMGPVEQYMSVNNANWWGSVEDVDEPEYVNYQVGGDD